MYAHRGQLVEQLQHLGLRPAEPVQLGQHQNVAGPQPRAELEPPLAVQVLAGELVDVQPLPIPAGRVVDDPVRGEGMDLAVQVLLLGRDAGIPRQR
jgi:hypothetical protein